MEKRVLLSAEDIKSEKEKLRPSKGAILNNDLDFIITLKGMMSSPK